MVRVTIICLISTYHLQLNLLLSLFDVYYFHIMVLKWMLEVEVLLKYLKVLLLDGISSFM